MSQHFQIAIIGSGPGGYIAALKAGQMGAGVACIERHPFFGGTCLNWGCIPSKAILATAELMHTMQHAEQWGIEIHDKPLVNWADVQKRKDRTINALRGGIKSLFEARKVTPFHGFAKLTAPGRIAVTGEDGAVKEEITADHVIIASGSEAAMIPGWPEDREIICTSDEAVHWKDLPEKLLIIGGGVIGVEFVCMMRPLGVEVTVVEMMPKLMPGMDGHLGEELRKTLEKRGVRIYTDTKVEDLSLGGPGAVARLSNGDTIEADRVLVATGRKPATRDMGLEHAGIETSRRGFIHVNEYFETGVANHYCIGDANGQCLLAHAASAHGVATVENILGHKKPFEAPIPSAVFTFPEVAGVGLTQEQAREKSIPIAIGSFPLGHLGKAMASNHTEGFVKIIRHRETSELLGAHIIGHGATEMIHAASALLHQKVKVQDVVETVFSHPTMSEAIREASEDALGMALHLPPRKVMRVKVGAPAGAA